MNGGAKLAKELGFLISMGGDGTILRHAHTYLDLDIQW